MAEHHNSVSAASAARGLTPSVAVVDEPPAYSPGGYAGGTPMATFPHGSYPGGRDGYGECQHQASSPPPTSDQTASPLDEHPSRPVTPYQQGWIDLLGQYEWPCFFTGTYSDEKLEKRYGKRAEYVMRSPTSVLNDFERFKYGTTLRGRHFVAAEPTWYRGIYHLHGLLDCPPQLLRPLWYEWFRTRGFCRFETPQNGVSVTGYVSKYVLKQLDPDDYRFQLSRRDGRRR